MANQRKEGKKMVGFFATEEEKTLLQKAAELAGFDNLSDYLRWIARAQPKPGAKPSPKGPSEGEQR